MAASEPEIRASMLAGLAPMLAGLHPPLALPDLMEAAGLPRDQKPDPNVGLSLNGYARLLTLAAARAGDDCFGLHFAKAFPRGGTGALGFVALNAPDLRTSLDCLCRYVHLQCEALEFTFAEQDGVARLGLVCGPAIVAPRKQFLEFVMALVVLRLGGEFGDGWLPLKAEFEYREPRCGGEYELLFGRQTQFDAPETALTVRSDLLKIRSARADNQLYALLRNIAEKELALLDRSHDLVWQTGEFIVASLAMRQATLEAAAAKFGRSPRQLQSDLKRHGTTFDEELTRTRRALAERYLRDTDLPLTEIALLLGFSELSAFTRAARGWLGQPPSQWRQQLREPGDK